MYTFKINNTDHINTGSINYFEPTVNKQVTAVPLIPQQSFFHLTLYAFPQLLLDCFHRFRHSFRPHLHQTAFRTGALIVHTASREG